MFSYLIAFLLGAALSGASAWQVQTWRFNTANLKAVEKSAEDFRKSEKQSYAASTSFEQKREKVRTEFITIFKETNRVASQDSYSATCFDDSGLRNLNSAIAATGDPSEPSIPLPPVDKPE